MSRVLIMDDNSLLRDVLGLILSRLGHEVQYAAHGEEAIALYTRAHESQCPFDVVILDLKIQDGMGGKETMARILSIDTHAKAIIASGHVNSPVVTAYEHYGFLGVLVKPYGMKELEAAILKVLGETEAKVSF
jgi:CheY-like chemotaxis protein